MIQKKPKEPVWVLRAVVEAMHHDQLREHGGLPGLRDEAALDAALNRARNKWAYEEADMATMAAAYAFGVAKSHPFNDGNKRSAFVTMMLFLERNGHSLEATDAEVVATILALAAGELSESKLKDWIQARLRKSKRGSSA